MNWSGRRVLVTGAGGFIGSHLTEELTRLGATTRALVHYNALGSSGWLDSSAVRDDVEVIAGDICDPDVARRIMEDVDVVFHLAALIAIPYSYRAPFSYLRTNAEGTMNLLLAARASNVERFVHTSTSEVYGSAVYVPIDEGHPLQAQSPYAASKIAADKLAEACHWSFGLPVVTIRPFNTFGPRQSARAVVPTIVAQCLAGDVVRLGNQWPKRDLNYVSNTVDGFIRGATAPEAVGQTINLGSGCEVTIGELVQMVAKIVGWPVRVEEDGERKRRQGSEVERLLAANGLAMTLLGWKPRVTLEEGLHLTIDWIREHITTYRPGVYTI